MTQKNERRLCERHPVNAPVIYTTNRKHEYYYATMYNYSSTGIYFKSTAPLKIGCNIYIKVETNSKCNTHKKMSRDYQAEVIWCKEVENSDIIHYEIGVTHDIHNHDNNNFMVSNMI